MALRCANNPDSPRSSVDGASSPRSTAVEISSVDGDFGKNSGGGEYAGGSAGAGAGAGASTNSAQFEPTTFSRLSDTVDVIWFNNISGMLYYFSEEDGEKLGFPVEKFARWLYHKQIDHDQIVYTEDNEQRRLSSLIKTKEWIQYETPDRSWQLCHDTQEYRWEDQLPTLGIRTVLQAFPRLEHEELVRLKRESLLNKVDEETRVLKHENFVFNEQMKKVAAWLDEYFRPMEEAAKRKKEAAKRKKEEFLAEKARLKSERGALMTRVTKILNRAAEEKVATFFQHLIRVAEKEVARGVAAQVVEAVVEEALLQAAAKGLNLDEWDTPIVHPNLKSDEIGDALERWKLLLDEDEDDRTLAPTGPTAGASTDAAEVLEKKWFFGQYGLFHEWIAENKRNFDENGCSDNLVNELVTLIFPSEADKEQMDAEEIPYLGKEGLFIPNEPFMIVWGALIANMKWQVEQVKHRFTEIRGDSLGGYRASFIKMMSEDGFKEDKAEKALSLLGFGDEYLNLEMYDAAKKLVMVLSIEVDLSIVDSTIVEDEL